MAVDFFGLAVWGAGVVEEHGGAEAVDDHVFGAVAEEVGDEAVGVALVGDGLGHARAFVLADADAFAEGSGGVAAGGVDGGGADDESGKHVAFRCGGDWSR